jgi:hypothetical protein
VHEWARDFKRSTRIGQRGRQPMGERGDGLAKAAQATTAAVGTGGVCDTIGEILGLSGDVGKRASGRRFRFAGPAQ